MSDTLWPSNNIEICQPLLKCLQTILSCGNISVTYLNQYSYHVGHCSMIFLIKGVKQAVEQWVKMRYCHTKPWQTCFIKAENYPGRKAMIDIHSGESYCKKGEITFKFEWAGFSLPLLPSPSHCFCFNELSYFITYLYRSRCHPICSSVTLKKKLP